MDIKLNKAVQWGLVVRDIDKAMRHWSAVFDMGPFLHVKRIAPHEHEAFYFGEPSDVRLTVAYSYFGETQVEIIQQLNDAPSPYVDFLKAGRSGMQHVGFWTHDYDSSYAGLVAAGYEMTYRAKMRGVPRDTVYFQDLNECFGPMLELSLLTPRKTLLFGAMADRVRSWSRSSHVEAYDCMDDMARALGQASWTVAS